MKSPLLLPLLTACHVFADGEIGVTCDELPDCESDADTDADLDTDLDLELSAGVALSTTDVQQWLATAYAPPDLTPRLERGGPGDTTGAVAWSVDRNRLYLASDGVLYVLGASKTDITRFEIPTDEPVLDMEPVGQSLYLITESWLLLQPSPNSELERLNETSDGLQFLSMTLDGDFLYIISSEGSSGPDLLALETATGARTLLHEDFASSNARINGDIFIGADGNLMSCSRAGAIYSLDAMLDGDTDPEVLSFVESNIEDALTCGQDARTGRYMVISSASGLFLTTPGEAEIQVQIAEAGHTIDGAYIY